MSQNVSSTHNSNSNATELHSKTSLEELTRTLQTYSQALDLHCYYSRGFIRSRLPAVNRRLRCLSPPVTKPHIQESSSCNIKYRNGQKQL